MNEQEDLARKTPENFEENHCNCSKRFWIGAVALLLLFVGITGVTITCFVMEQKVLQYNHHYGVIFDAGSSHTDITVYRWPSDYKDHGTAHTEQITFQKCADVGISSYQNNPEQAGDMIRKCVDQVAMKNLPHKDVKKTIAYLGATAGMRLLCERDHDACEKIMKSIMTAMNGYKFRQVKNRVRVLTGLEEGTFGWITANLLNNALNLRVPAEKNPKLVGALDMGGGSAEISFIPQDLNAASKEDTSYLTLYGVNYTLYTHSYLCYGFKEAQRKLMAHLVEASNYSSRVIHPCWQKGYNETVAGSWIWLSPCSKKPSSSIFPLKNTTMYKFVGNGSAEACENRIHDLFNKSKCETGNCTFDGIYQPPLRGHFMAYSGFGHIGGFLNITKGDELSELKTKGKQLCAEDWNTVVQENKDIKTKYLRNYCFEALYSHEFLTYGLHFKPESNDVHITKNINGTEVGWSLGYMVNATNSVPTEGSNYRLTQQELVSLLVVCFLIALVGLSMLIVCCVKRRIERNMKYKYTMVN